MSEARGLVPGTKNEHPVMFYGLSTCVWCKRTRQFLEDQAIQFQYIYIDKLKGQEREEAIEQVRRWNPAVSFPTVVIGNEQCVIGYKPDRIKEALDL